MTDKSAKRAIHYAETDYGFEYGAAKVERVMSHAKDGWVDIGIRTPKANIVVYVTRSGLVRVIDGATGKEWKKP